MVSVQGYTNTKHNTNNKQQKRNKKRLKKKEKQNKHKKHQAKLKQIKHLRFVFAIIIPNSTYSINGCTVSVVEKIFWKQNL